MSEYINTMQVLSSPTWTWTDLEGALIGGVLISLASTLNFFIFGRNESLHEMFSAGAKLRRDQDQLMRVSFLFGLATLPFFAAKGYFPGFNMRINLAG